MAVGGGLVYVLDPEHGDRRRARASRRLNGLLRRGSELAQDQGLTEVAGALDRAGAATRKRGTGTSGSIIVKPGP